MYCILWTDKNFLPSFSITVILNFEQEWVFLQIGVLIKQCSKVLEQARKVHKGNKRKMQLFWGAHCFLFPHSLCYSELKKQSKSLAPCWSPLIFWHPWDPWGRIHIDLNKNSVQTGCVNSRAVFQGKSGRYVIFKVELITIGPICK